MRYIIDYHILMDIIILYPQNKSQSSLSQECSGLTLMANNTMCSQQFQQRHFKQSLVEQELPGCRPRTRVTLKALLNELLQKHLGYTLDRLLVYKHSAFISAKYARLKSPRIIFNIHTPSLSDMISPDTLFALPSVMGPPATGWQCWWPPQKYMKTLHFPGSPEEPSATHACTHVVLGVGSGHSVI